MRPRLGAPPAFGLRGAKPGGRRQAAGGRKFKSKPFSPQGSQRDTEKSKSLFMGKSTSKTFAPQRAQRDTEKSKRLFMGKSTSKAFHRRGRRRSPSLVHLGTRCPERSERVGSALPRPKGWGRNSKAFFGLGSRMKSKQVREGKQKSEK